MAEQSNLIREIGLWAIRRALDDRIQLGLERYPGVAVSVNVSARQLAEDGFLATLNGLLTERGIPPQLLRLELTESAFIETPDRTITLIGELRRIGVAEVDLDEPLSGTPWPAKLNGAWHHMGTARMHDSPRKGVVDRHCRVHGIPNLYIAGAAVFPTAGANFPTFTLTALSLRLADHLVAQFSRAPAAAAATIPA